MEDDVRRNVSQFFQNLGTRTYVVDSGASYHIMSNSDLTEHERESIRKLNPPIPLQTANGLIQAKSAVKIHIIELDLEVEALILPNSPPLLSLGRLCCDHEVKYVWDGLYLIL